MDNAETVFIRKLENVQTVLADVVRQQAIKMRERIKRRFLSGTQTGPKKLAKRSGALFNATVVGKSTRTANEVSTNVDVRKRYASLHIGIAGRANFIRPKKSKALAIPLRAARDARGVPKGGPLSPQFQPSFISGGVIYKRDPTNAASVTPLFILKNSVIVRTRISLENDIQRPAVKPFEIAVARAVDTL